MEGKRGFFLIERETHKLLMNLNDPTLTAAYLTLYGTAVYKPMEVIFDGQKRTLNPGEACIRLSWLKEKLQLKHKSAALKVLRRLEEHCNLRIETSRNQRTGGIIITFPTWDFEQRTKKLPGNSKPDDSQVVDGNPGTDEKLSSAELEMKASGHSQRIEHEAFASYAGTGSQLPGHTIRNKEEKIDNQSSSLTTSVEISTNADHTPPAATQEGETDKKEVSSSEAQTKETTTGRAVTTEEIQKIFRHYRQTIQKPIEPPTAEKFIEAYTESSLTLTDALQRIDGLASHPLLRFETKSIMRIFYFEKASELIDSRLNAIISTIHDLGHSKSEMEIFKLVKFIADQHKFDVIELAKLLKQKAFPNTWMRQNNFFDKVIHTEKQFRDERKSPCQAKAG